MTKRIAIAALLFLSGTANAERNSTQIMEEIYDLDAACDAGDCDMAKRRELEIELYRVMSKAIQERR